MMFAIYPLNQHLLSDKYKDEVNELESRFKGEFILNYVKLLILHKNTNQVLSANEILRLVNKYHMAFYSDDNRKLRVASGLPAIDILEVMRFFIEALHEELNLVFKRPPDCDVDLDFVDPTDIDVVFREYKKHFKERDNSFIRDLFVGIMLNQYVCQRCGKKRTTFECFSDIVVEMKDIPEMAEDFYEASVNRYKPILLYKLLRDYFEPCEAT
jgi:ubiquitin C-terminal hydrolase